MDEERSIHSTTDNRKGENEIANSIKLSDIEYKLIAYVTSSPGIRYRELLRKSHLSNGSFFYHIKRLERIGHVHSTRKRKITRYYPALTSKEETIVLDFLTQSTSKLILLHLAQYGPCSTNDLMKVTGKARSTIFWHAKRLQRSQLLISRYIDPDTASQNHNYNQNRIFHSVTHELVNRELVIRIITKYRNQSI
jgi:predicted transcriptional regulator